MQGILDLVRYRELLEKENFLKLQNQSLLFENRDEFLEFLSYNSRLQNHISYQRMEDYYSLIFQYIEKLITPQSFQWEFLEMEKQDGNTAKILLNDFKQSETFAVDLISIKFGSLLSEIYKLSKLAQEFGPEDGISNEDFRESIQKIYNSIKVIYLQLQNILKNYRTDWKDSTVDQLNWETKDQYFELIDEFLNGSSNFLNFKERYQSIVRVGKELESNSISLKINYQALGFSNYILILIQFFDSYQIESIKNLLRTPEEKIVQSIKFF